MPFLDQIVLAASAAPQPGGTLNLFGASWDTIAAPAVPIQQEEFALLLSLLLSREEAQQEHQITVAMTGPSGTSIGRMKVTVGAATEEQIALLPDGGRVRVETVLNARGVVYPEYGRYELSILWDEEPLREPMVLMALPVDIPPEVSE